MAVLFYYMTLVAVVIGASAVPLPNHPSADGGGDGQHQATPAKNGCPEEFIVKYKRASEVCQKETSALYRDDSGTVALVHTALERSRRNEPKSSDKVDSEIVLCTYQKLKQLPTFAQLANFEKECTSSNNSKAEDKSSSEEEDAETGLANCLMEKMEAMCPALASAV